MEIDNPFSVHGIESILQTIAIGLSASFLAHVIWTAAYNLFFHPLSNYPGPALRAAFSFPESFSVLNGLGYKDTKRLHDRYGSVVRISPSVLSYNTSQAWKDIYGLKADRTELAKDPAYYKKGDAPSILVANQAEHTRIRKHFQHAFSDGALLEQEPLLTSYFNLLIEQLKRRVDGPSSGPVDIMAFYNFTTFDIIGDLALGESFGALEGGEYHQWIRNVFESIRLLGVFRFIANNPILGTIFRALHLVTPSLAAKRHAHLEFTRDKIERRFARETDRKDFISYILHNDDQRGMTHPEILASSRVLLTAGSETTATLLSGTTYFLLTNPSWLARVQAEIREAFHTSEEITLRSVSQPGLLPLLEAVLQESLRCYPPLPGTLPRVTGSKGAIIDSKFVPQGISVGVHQWSTYRSRKNFLSPDLWDPDRWLEGEAAAKYRNDDKSSLQPFSLGPRGCIGKSLAYFETRSILARVLWTFDLQLDEASQTWLQQKEYALWDKPPLWVKLKHRAGLRSRAESTDVSKV